MRRICSIHWAGLTLALAFACSSLPLRAAQSPAVSKTPAAPTPASPPSAEMRTPPWGVVPQPEIVVVKPPREAPESVVIPQGTRINVTLDTPLSTRISKTGQLVNFRTADPLTVYQDLVIPADTLFSGKVVETHKPGAFGKSGILRVKVDRIELSNGAGAEVLARLDSQDLDGKGRLQSDNNRTADLASIGMWTLQGTLLGAHIQGGKGAAVGAGAGATIAMLILMSRHGSDVYLEPGTPFSVILDHDVSLPGAAVAAIQPNPPGESAAAPDPASPGTADAKSSPADAKAPAAADPSRPELKRRPKK